jgi:hypothetical protein
MNAEIFMTGIRTPMGDLEPWKQVVLDDLSSAINARGIHNSPDHRANANVAHDNSVPLSLGEQDRVGVKMVSPLGVGLLARDIEKKVGGESEDLLADEHVQGVDGSVAEELIPVELVVVLLGNAEVLTCLGDVDFVALHRGVVAVVPVMADAPREVGSPHCGVCKLKKEENESE